ncbi:RNA polymerase sigma factor [Porcipelethomonas sp.]|uniref:RNA polymerase sigma factor n=1 Tax=Porcipelethomonas sp. TaxID=2981675 RepID=UPI003EF945AA
MTDFQNDVKLARKGDTEAFSRLYAVIYKEMYHTALYNLRSPHDAYDAVSETVIDAFSSIGRLKNEDAFKSWIMKILFSKIKQKQKEYYKNDSDNDDDSINNLRTEDFDFEYSELKNALESLDDESRGILSLSVLGGYTSEEIAGIYGLKPSSVRSKLSRIKKELRLTLTL